jgi:hypothetical protein
MTEVTFFEDYHCFEYHTPQGAVPRFSYFLYVPVYERIPLRWRFTTQRPLPCETAVYSSDFLPFSLSKIFQ